MSLLSYNFSYFISFLYLLNVYVKHIYVNHNFGQMEYLMQYLKFISIMRSQIFINQSIKCISNLPEKAIFMFQNDKCINNFWMD